MTITLDSDVAELLKRKMRKRKQSMKTVVHDHLRTAPDTSIEPSREPYEVKPTYVCG